MMDPITLLTRAAAIFGCNATEAEVLAKAKEVMREAEKANVVSEHDRVATEKMKAMNCDRATAEFAIAEQQRYEKNPPPRH